MLKQIFTLMTALVICSSSWAGTCNTATIAASTPSSRFSDDGAIVTDHETTLSWMRCAVGQEWRDKQCSGDPKIIDWQQATALVDEINAQGFGGFNDWRMPMIPELASIIELQCFNPRVNTTLFPDTPSVIFWTSMEKMGKPDYVYTLDFGGGEAVATAKSQAGAIRLVRGGPWWEPPSITKLY